MHFNWNTVCTFTLFYKKRLQLIPFNMEEVVQLQLWNKIVGCVVPLLIIIVNSTEIHILRNVRKKAFYEKILLSLTFCDLICGVYETCTVPFVCFVKVEYHVWHWIVWAFIISYCTLNSIMHLVIISVDRLWAIATPLHHRIHASNKKVLIAVTFSWSIPTLYLIANITSVLLQGLDAHQIYSYTRTTMAKYMAQIFIVADMILVVFYCAIIFVISKKESLGKQNKHSNQRKSLRTITLCISIALVFVMVSTPYVVANLIDWERPFWLVKLSIFLFPVNQMLNSLLYLIQKGHAKKEVIVAQKNTSVCTNREVTLEDICL